jgi:hypothetical protein
VVVKIDNVDQARPQTGINEADVVYEVLVEGGLTRLAAVFQSHYPTLVGPVRSGRLTDEGIADDLNHPVYAYSGTNGNFLPILRSQPLVDADDSNQPGKFWRLDYAPEPHNLYTNIAALAKLDTPGSVPPALFHYLPTGSSFGNSTATPAAGVTIHFPAATIAWAWNAQTGRWLRSQNGTPDVVRNGPQLSATNIVVEDIPYVISLSGYEDGVFTQVPTGEFVGQGVAWYLSQGKVEKGTWTRTSLTTPTTFLDSTGAPVQIPPGQTWVEVPPDGTVPTLVG